MKKIINYFLQGLLYTVPITVTGAFVVWTFNKIDTIIPGLFPGLGLIIVIVLITIIVMPASDDYRYRLHKHVDQ